MANLFYTMAHIDVKLQPKPLKTCSSRHFQAISETHKGVVAHQLAITASQQNILNSLKAKRL